MFTSRRFREKAAEYEQLAKGTADPGTVREFQRLERSYTDLANNDEWLASNFDKTIPPGSKDSDDDQSLNEEEEDVLRCLGAAVVLQWNTIPTKLQRELFDNAGSVGELLRTNELKGQITGFLHKRKGGYSQCSFCEDVRR
jgi:hypothetical protein